EQLLNLARRIQDLKHLSLEGLMTMPPYFDSPEMSRPYYVPPGIQGKDDERRSCVAGALHGDVE
ncbi:MAG: hypothetical protein ACXU99_12945, partial [Thermodesulfobacteriota bacterium]